MRNEELKFKNEKLRMVKSFFVFHFSLFVLLVTLLASSAFAGKKATLGSLTVS